MIPGRAAAGDVARFERRAAGYDGERMQERFFVPVQRATLELVASLVPDGARTTCPLVRSKEGPPAARSRGRRAVPRR